MKFCELQASSKQTGTLVQQNKQLVDQNADLSTKVTEVIACSTSPGKRKKIRLEVSLLTKVCL